ncbi:MAG: hypothetical protein ACYDGY_05285 [Acidimicrobiales bacterium]
MSRTPEESKPGVVHDAGREWQALQPENGTRQRWTTTRVTIVAAVLVAIAGASLSLGLSHGRSQGGALSRVATAPAGRFTGTWVLENFSLTFHHDGRGSAEWRTLVNCGTGPGHGPPPCDPLVKQVTRLPNGTSRTIEVRSDGGRAAIFLASVRGDTARGVVEHSNELSILPNGPATFRLGLNDLLYTSVSRPTSSSPFGRSPFCGAKAASLTLRQAASEGISCG